MSQKQNARTEGKLKERHLIHDKQKGYRYEEEDRARKLIEVRKGKQKMVAKKGTATTASRINSSRRLALMVAIEKSSVDPRGDFSQSMVEVILANRIEHPRDLRYLLNCYLSMNSKEYKEVILEVFHQADIADDPSNKGFEVVQEDKRGLPSFMKTNTLPASPLEIRSSSSRLNFKGGWLEIVLATDEAVFCTELLKLWNGERSIFCPKNSTLSGRTKLSVSWGVPIMPSTNLICMEVEGKS
ncbi:hypothetical protein Cgig2_027644 [Carnegiea gigantea]|uniref:Transcription repressor n=1 Tax=Carnegiea gigantea TaxID=171969 RepID=A0A9Q1GXS4_9CARY|nr:hypothetical protein Cgig2_027644 [Carnegiea gigantea]